MHDDQNEQPFPEIDGNLADSFRVNKDNINNFLVMDSTFDVDNLFESKITFASSKSKKRGITRKLKRIMKQAKKRFKQACAEEYLFYDQDLEDQMYFYLRLLQKF